MLTEKIDDLHKIAKALLIYETLSGDEIRDLILARTLNLQDHLKRMKMKMEKTHLLLDH